MAEYGFLDKCLHRLALQVPALAEASFDIDQKLVRTNIDTVASARHVFVSGLARSGTTVLMRRFHATGIYRSLIYRDMPFVLAPNLWSKIAANSTTRMRETERAHGDGILIGADSPESLEEPFWRIFCGSEYIHKNCITPHSPDEQTLRRYVRYVSAILSSRNQGLTRYLSKNNNNILRLASIRRAFPNAVILIPFREPLAQANSLLRQHEVFCDLQERDKFVLSYMNWLAHHEFGLGHKPYCFENPMTKPHCEYDLCSIEYWLLEWCAVHEWLENTAPPDAFFVCYEDLCSSPDLWQALCERAGIGSNDLGNELFRKSNNLHLEVDNNSLMRRASAIYQRLQFRSASLA